MKKENILKTSAEKRKDYIKDRLIQLFDEVQNEVCGYLIVIFDSDGNKIEAYADSQGILDSDILCRYLKMIGALRVQILYGKKE